MLKKIISSGQPGAEQAALDVAMELGFNHGGWVPEGRRSEAGLVPEKYQLQEMPTESSAGWQEQNVLHSDGTLIICREKLTGGSALTREMAEKNNRPLLHIDLNAMDPFAAAKAISYWLEHHKIEILNVAGSRPSKDANIYDAAKSLLRTALRLSIIDMDMPEPSRETPLIPCTVEEAVEDLSSKLPLKAKTNLARMEEADLLSLQSSLGRYIRMKYGLWSTNKALMESCRITSGQEDLSRDEAAALIIRELWKNLRASHTLRVVK